MAKEMKSAQGNAGSAPEKPTVAFLGPVASYSHQCTLTKFSDQEWHLLSTATIQDVFDAIQSRRARYGVVPLENSINGPVSFTLDALADRDNTNPDVRIYGDIYFAIRHCLLGHGRVRDDDDRHEEPTYTHAHIKEKDSGPAKDEKAVPSTADPYPNLENNNSPLTTQGINPPAFSTTTPFSHIHHLLSHPQALGQTQSWCKSHLPYNITVHETSSTSRAAELAGQDDTGRTAAVAGEVAGRVFGLEVLARGIEDGEGNRTRFVVLGRGKEVDRKGKRKRKWKGKGKKMGEEGKEEDGKRLRALVSFALSTENKSRGALGEALDCFRREGLPIISINSVPSRVEPFQRIYFIEFDSAVHDSQGRVQSALEGLDALAQQRKWHGRWESELEAPLLDSGWR